MHEITESTACALSHFILTTACLSKVSYRTQLCMDCSTPKPPVIEVHNSLFSIFFIFELYIHIANKMVPKVVAHIHLFDLSIPILALHENLLKEVVVVLLHLLIADR